VNADRYLRWLLETQTPLVLLSIAAPVVAWVARRRAAANLSSTAVWLGSSFAGVVVLCYLPYSPFEAWWYLRFLLPALPVLLIFMSWMLVQLVGRTPRLVRALLLASGLALLAGHYVAVATDRSVFALDELESRYITAGEFAAARLPVNAILFSVQESGPLRLYGRRTTVRFDYIDPQGLDAAVQFLDRAGYRPYFALEAWEEAQFRDRFSSSSPLGLLDWPPAAEVGRPVKVRFYDPRDRARFLAGEPVRTAHDPGEGRDTR
jgi:hypothetical protein